MGKMKELYQEQLEQLEDEEFQPPTTGMMKEWKELYGSDSDSEDWEEEFKRTRLEAVERGLSHADWSIPKTDFKEALPPDFLDGIKFIRRNSAWNGVLVALHPEFPYLKTWGDLYQLCDSIMGACGDTDHRFIEGFSRDGDTLVIQCGS